MTVAGFRVEVATRTGGTKYGKLLVNRLGKWPVAGVFHMYAVEWALFAAVLENHGIEIQDASELPPAQCPHTAQ